MLAKLPIISSAAGLDEIIYAFVRMHKETVSKEFGLALSGFLKSRYVYLTNSGISSFYVILKMLKKKSEKKEVILPAYTAGSLVSGVLKAGLKPVLCDINLNDFNLDRDSLLNMVSKDTLAVVCVHAFGIGMSDVEQLRKKIPADVFMIEDCAQAMGSKINGRQAGCFLDFGLFSFNRGKNLPLCGGGCIVTGSDGLTGWDNPGDGGCGFAGLLKVMAFSLVTNRFIYGIGYPVISRFKDVSPPKDFTVRGIANFHAGLGLKLLRDMDEISSVRYQNGMVLINGLKDAKDIILPDIAHNTMPAFNRMPLVFRDLAERDKVERGLWQAGIETSRMYIMPLHHMFDLGYKKEEFPNADYFARHLLTLPVHPLVRHEDLLKMIKVIKER